MPGKPSAVGSILQWDVSCGPPLTRRCLYVCPLQVLLSQVHRVRALDLLSRFLDLGPWAVNQALSVGIFPYVLKLLQASARELRPLLVIIWAKIMALDPVSWALSWRKRGQFGTILAEVVATARSVWHYLGESRGVDPVSSVLAGRIAWLSIRGLNIIFPK